MQCGDNGPTQTTVAQQPTDIVFEKVTIPQHRGKRGFEINCAARLLDSRALDVYSPAALDSQALAVLNTCGPVSVVRGEYFAASENILVGGDSLKISGLSGRYRRRSDLRRADDLEAGRLAHRRCQAV